MNNKNIIKYLLDIILAIGFMLMYDKMAIGIRLHELFGLGLGTGILVHLILNYKWVVGISKKIFSSKINHRTRLLYIINILLLICMILIILGGIFISKTILTSLHSQNQGFWKGIHVGASYIALMLIGVHIGLNFNWIKGMTRKLLKIKESKKYTQIIARILVCIVFVFGVYNIYSQNFMQKTLMVFKINQSQTMGDHPMKNHPMGDIENGKEVPNEQIKPDVNKENMSDEEIKNLEEMMKNKDNISGEHKFKGDFSKTSPITLVINYTSILSVFIIVTYYIDKLIKIRNKRNII